MCEGPETKQWDLAPGTHSPVSCCFLISLFPKFVWRNQKPTYIETIYRPEWNRALPFRAGRTLRGAPRAPLPRLTPGSSRHWSWEPQTS